jgi:hypothetical protein
MSIQLRAKYDPNQAYHYYYDLDIINNNVSGDQKPVIFNFIEARNQPYLYCPENYFMSIVRFSLQTPSLPKFIPTVKLGQNDPNVLVYAITLNYRYVAPGGNVPDFNSSFSANVQYVPFDESQPIPSAPTTKQDFSSYYYYIYSYQEWILMINTCFQNAFNNLQVAYANWATANIVNITAWNSAFPNNAIPTTLTATAPFMEFDPHSLNAIINGDTQWYNTSNTANKRIDIFFNNALYQLYHTFPSTTTLFNGVYTNKMLMNSFNNFNLFTTTSITYLQAYQEASTAVLLNPISSVVFTTGLLPVNNELVSVPKSNTIGGVSSGSGAANIAPIITDFQVPFSALDQYIPNIQYTPSAEYRLVDMSGTSPLSAIQISVYWKDYYGNLIPFYLNAGCGGNIKIMFRRKDYANINLGL